MRMVWTEPKENGQAKRLRDAKARGLRKQGYTVKVETVSFSDLGRGASFILEASNEQEEGEARYRQSILGDEA